MNKIIFEIKYYFGWYYVDYVFGMFVVDDVCVVVLLMVLVIGLL